MSPLALLTIFRALLEREQARKLARKLAPPGERLIPSFSAGGDRDRWYSLAGCLHLEARGDVIVKRNRRGMVLAILFRHERGGNPLKATLQPGQRYSFQDRVADSHVWQHKNSILENEETHFQRAALDVATH